MPGLAAAVLLSRRSELKKQRKNEMSTQIPTGRLNQIGPAQEDSGNFSAPVTFLRGKASEAMAPSGGQGEEGGAKTPLSPQAGWGGCADTLHELANTVNAVLINAQLLEWKLPPYSRLKRPVREIERHAQRSGALLKRLLRQFEAEEEATQDLCGQVPALHGTGAAVTAQGPDATTRGPAKLLSLAPSLSAPVSCFPPKNELTTLCDPCTSSFFPKEE